MFCKNKMGIGFSNSYNQRKVRPIVDINTIITEEYVHVLPPSPNNFNDYNSPRIQLKSKPITIMSEIQETSEENEKSIKIQEEEEEKKEDFSYLSSSPSNEIIENNNSNINKKNKKKKKKKKN